MEPGDFAPNVEKIAENKQMETSLEEMSQTEKMNTDFVDPFSSPSTSVRGRSFSNMFAAKKTVAQGMMDIALITANANQLRYLLEFKQESTFFYTILMLIIISLCLQVIVGVILIFKGRFDLQHEKLEHAIRLNNYVIFGVFLITIINVFIAAFSMSGSSSGSATHE